MKILHNDTDGNLVITTPSEAAIGAMNIDDIAKKVVPEGLPYKIVEDNEIPTDRENRNFWAVDSSELNDGVGGESNESN